MSGLLITALAVGAAILVIGGVVTSSMRLTEKKQLRPSRGVAEGAPALSNEWVGLSGSGGSDCSAADNGGGCD